MTDQQLHINVVQLSRRLALLEAKVDFVLRELKIEFQDDLEPAHVPQINALVAQGKVLDAIRLYREQTGADLVSAKAFIDGLPKSPK